MQGVVTDSRGAYVKAAIVRLLKAGDDGSGAVSVTYAETDEEGRFVIRELDPDEKYIIEIDVKPPEQPLKNEEEAEAGKEGPVLSAEETREPDEETDEPVAEASDEVQEAADEVQEAADEAQKAADEDQEAAGAEPEYKSEEVKLVLSPEIVVAEPPYHFDEPDFDDEEEIFAEEFIISADHVYWDKKDHFTSIEYTVTENLSFSSLYDVPGFNLKDKPYLKKSNLW